MARKPQKAVSTAALMLAALICFAPLAVVSRAEAFVFWTNVGGTIGRANLDGSGADARFITLHGGNPYPSGIALDASHVYWSDFNNGTIGRANLDGTRVNRNFIAAGSHPGGLAVDDAHIYWGDDEITNSPQLSGGSIGRANLDGTGVERQFIPGGDPFGVSVARSPAVNASHLYWSDIGAAPMTIGRASLDGTAFEPSFIEFPLGVELGTDQTTVPVGIAVDADHVYWANIGDRASNGTIGRAGIDGTGMERKFITGIGTPDAVAADDAHIYWTNGETAEHGGSVGRARLDGTGVEPNFIPGTPVRLPNGVITVSPSPASTVAVDSSNDFSFGQVNKDESTGTATLTVKIAEGPGKLRLANSKTVNADKAGVKRVGTPPKTKLAIKPKGKVSKRLNKKGKATVKVRVTYSPGAGAPKTGVKKIALVRR
jgi:virginiamycin B lyase